MTTPQVPDSTGRTRRFFHGTLVQRRIDLGLSMRELAERWTTYAREQAEKFGEPTDGISVSRQYIWKLEHMFDPDANEQLKRLRRSTSLNSYGIWARCLGLRLRLELIEADEQRELLLVPPRAAKMTRRITALPTAHQEHLAAIVDALWEAYEAGEDGHPVLRSWHDS